MKVCINAVYRLKLVVCMPYVLALYTVSIYRYVCISTLYSLNLLSYALYSLNLPSCRYVSVVSIYSALYSLKLPPWVYVSVFYIVSI